MNQDYERNHSHTHCWNQKSPACGQPLEDHKQCCLCDLRYKQTEEHSKCCGKKKIACALSHLLPSCEAKFHCFVCGRPFLPQELKKCECKSGQGCAECARTIPEQEDKCCDGCRDDEIEIPLLPCEACKGHSPKPESEDWDRTKAHSEDLADRFTEAQQEEWIKEFDKNFQFDGVTYKGQRHWKEGVKQSLVKSFISQQIEKAEKRGQEKGKEAGFFKGYNKGSQETKASIIEMLRGMERILPNNNWEWEDGWNTALGEVIMRLNEKHE